LGSSSVDSLPVKKQNPFDLGSSPASSPPAKRQKTTDSPGGKVASSLILSRNQAAKTSAKQRDNFRCVLTGDGSIEAAHIYPYHSLKNKEEDIFGPRHIFWDHLKNFWPVEKVAAWEAELFPNGMHEIGIERVYNLITLSPVAHSYWNRGAFALKPISVDDNNTTLKVQFFWQKKQNNTQATMSLLTTPFSTKDLDQNEGAFDFGNTRLTDIRGPQPCYIKSGDIFELKTDNAEARPLPSFALLEMQWFLTRVVGMAGAAVPYDEDWGDEDSDDAAVLYEAGWGDEVSDDEISNPGLEEAKDDSFVLSDPVLQDSPPFLRTGSLLPDEGSKHHAEAATGDGVEDRDGGREIK
jgi:hypothetical protein